jgi:cytoskeleton protein RodZ
MIDKEEQQETVILGPGQILKQARERAKLSSQDIADKMKLKKTLIEDIEQDSYDINLSLTFVRGYLKLYAKHVNVDEMEIINAFEKLSTQSNEPAKLQSFSRRVANQANDDKLMLVTYLIVAVVIALVVIWWFQQSPTTTDSNESNYPEAVVKETIAEDVLPIQESLPSESEASLPEDLDGSISVEDPTVTTLEVKLPPVTEDQTLDNPSVEKEIVNDSSNSDVQTDVLDTTTLEVVAPVELIFEFSGDCWMNLTDATGENIAYGVKVKGRTMPITGIPPFVVTLGAPEVVKIRYAGEPLDMSFLPSGRIAKFDLPLSE